MKKIKIIGLIFIAVLVAAATLFACDPPPEPKTFTVEFDYQGATLGITETSIEVGETYTFESLPVSSKPGYIYGGWFSLPDGQGTEYIAETEYAFTEDIILYMYWIPNNYVISFDYAGADSGITTETKQVLFEQSVGSLPAPGKNGYTFGGWYSGENGTGTLYTSDSIYAVRGPITLYASWHKTYKITFEYMGADGGDTAEKTRDIGLQMALGALPEPTKTGYVFIGWYTASQGGNKMAADTVFEYESDILLYARFVAMAFTITFDYQGATTAGVPQMEFPYGLAISNLPVPDRTGYSFEGWFTSPGGIGTHYTNGMIYSAATGFTLYAHWTAKKYTLTFDYQGADTGVEISTKQVTFNAAIGALPFPEKRGFVFAGWLMKSGEVMTSITSSYVYSLTDNLTISANFTGTSGLVYSKTFTGYNVSAGANKSMTTLAINNFYDGYPVEAIAVNGFKDCTAITEVLLPASVQKILDNAFEGCTALEAIDLSNITMFGDYAFRNSGLKNVVLPAGISAVSEGLFEGCGRLVSARLPETIMQISTAAFKNCITLTEINMPESLYIVRSEAFAGDAALETIDLRYVTTINGSAFKDCTKLNNLTLNNELLIIYQSTFENCSALSNIILPDGLTDIHDSAFKSTALTRFVMPVALVKILNSAFENCPIDTLVFNTVIDLIESYAFKNTKLTIIRFPISLSYIGAYAFDTETFVSAEFFVREEGFVTSLGEYAFGKSKTIKIYVPESQINSYINMSTGYVERDTQTSEITYIAFVAVVETIANQSTSSEVFRHLFAIKA